MQIEIKIAEDGSEKLEAVKKYHLDLLGSWCKVYGGVVFNPYEEEIHAKGLKILSHLLSGEWSGGVPAEDFTGKILRWAKLVERYDFSKIPPLDLSLISGTLLAIWEHVRMNVFPEGYIVLGGEPAFCPLYEPARKLWKTVKEGNAIAFELNRCEKVERPSKVYTQEER